MKTLLLLLIIQLVGTVSWANRYLDISTLQLQFRYEDTSVQSKETVAYQSYSTAYQMEMFRFGLLYSRHIDTSGNVSLNIDNEKKEYATSFGYQVFHTDTQDKKINFDIFAQGHMGISQSQVTTRLFGTSSMSSSSNILLGLGAAVIGRFSYLLLESDLDILTASSYSPQFVPAVTFKIGASIPF